MKFCVGWKVSHTSNKEGCSIIKDTDQRFFSSVLLWWKLHWKNSAAVQQLTSRFYNIFIHTYPAGLQLKLLPAIRDGPAEALVGVCSYGFTGRLLYSYWQCGERNVSFVIFVIETDYTQDNPHFSPKIFLWNCAEIAFLWKWRRFFKKNTDKI